jgi:hypothetical protein
MKNNIIIATLIVGFTLSSFTKSDTAEIFGKQFFKILKTSPRASQADIKSLFISLEALKTFPKTELSEFSQAEFDEYITESIDDLALSGEDEDIAWNQIEYVKTTSQSATERGIDLKVIDLYFKQSESYFVVKLITIVHEKQLKLIRMMDIEFAEQ